MQLITKEIMRKLEKQDPHSITGPGRELPDTEMKVIAKFFTPDAGWTWYAFSGSEAENGDVQMFGLVDGDCKEYGYFWLSELERNRGALGLKIERDLYFPEMTVAELKVKVFETKEDDTVFTDEDIKMLENLS